MHPPLPAVDSGEHDTKAALERASGLSDRQAWKYRWRLLQTVALGEGKHEYINAERPMHGRTRFDCGHVRLARGICAEPDENVTRESPKGPKGRASKSQRLLVGKIARHVGAVGNRGWNDASQSRQDHQTWYERPFHLRDRVQ